MKVYEAKIYFEDGMETVFQFTKYSFNSQMFKFVDAVKDVVRMFQIKNIKQIRIHYVGVI